MTAGNSFDRPINTSMIDHQLQTALKPFPYIRLAILFGSLASNSATFESDLDLAVQADEALTVEQKMRLIEHLAQQLLRPVDLVDLHEAGEPLLGQILTKGRRILGSDTAYGFLIAKHVYAEADFMPYQRRILKERREQWIKH